MFTVQRQIEIDAGHRVPYHDSKCRFLHGHRWRIVAEIMSNITVPPEPGRSDSGMVLDFGEIKRALVEEIHDKFDHKMILWEKDPLFDFVPPSQDDSFCEVLARTGIGDSVAIVPVIPTSECLAEYWGNILAKRLYHRHYWLSALKVWETPNCVATYHLPHTYAKT